MVTHTGRVALVPGAWPAADLGRAAATNPALASTFWDVTLSSVLPPAPPGGLVALGELVEILIAPVRNKGGEVAAIGQFEGQDCRGMADPQALQLGHPPTLLKRSCARSPSPHRHFHDREDFWPF
jgi:hypothetical protein